jgi:hypothetical protein
MSDLLLIMQLAELTRVPGNRVEHSRFFFRPTQLMIWYRPLRA